MSEELKDLIAQLLNKDPDQRPMCADIIEHAYFIVYVCILRLCTSSGQQCCEHCRHPVLIFFAIA